MTGVNFAIAAAIAVRATQSVSNAQNVWAVLERILLNVRQCLSVVLY